ncbi:hypothetical protein ZEAMMB73_Zm00001d019189 [Zea mays]|uniref:Uncharacterized protein n=1 Tax=Zea mays TaxID=4577 RepID=A0A1D6HW33_MAIZE|nr:hypothetical protein ZEAMMB73_Zm00001d019189 [Zea mays]
MKKIVQEMTRMNDERNRLRMIMAQYMAEDLASFSVQDLSNLEQQIEFSLYKVRLRKFFILKRRRKNSLGRSLTLSANAEHTLCFVSGSKSYSTSSCSRSAKGYATFQSLIRRLIKERISLLPPRPRVQRGERSRSNSNP